MAAASPAMAALMMGFWQQQPVLISVVGPEDHARTGRGTGGSEDRFFRQVRVSRRTRNSRPQEWIKRLLWWGCAPDFQGNWARLPLKKNAVLVFPIFFIILCSLTSSSPQ
jgi:hypothetical protein